MKTQDIPLSQLRPSPYNPRSSPKDGDIKSLAASIKAKGLLQPILVRQLKKDSYEIVAGERRFHAVKLAGLKTIAATVHKLTDREALELCVTENLQREDLSPMEEAKGVQSLLEKWDVKSVADHLGKPPGWVARRARLSHLTETWRALAANPECVANRWPATWLELIARLEPDTQDALVRDMPEDEMVEEFNYHYEQADSEQLRSEIARYTVLLSQAPWDLKDAALVPVAGPCVKCPKRSGAQPLLWDDEPVTKKGKKGDAPDRCLDLACWGCKLKAHGEAKLATLKAKHPDAIAISYRGDRGLAEDANLYERAKKGDKGAIPAVRVEGDTIGQLEYVKPRTDAAARDMQRTARKEQGKPTPLAERRAQLERRRQKLAIENIVKAVEEAEKVPKLEVCAGLAAWFGTAEKHTEYGSVTLWKEVPGKGYQDKDRTIDPYTEWTKDNHANHLRLWEQVRAVLIQRLKYYGSGTDTGIQIKEAFHLADLVAVNEKELWEAAVKQIKEPKAWAGLNENGTPKGGKR